MAKKNNDKYKIRKELKNTFEIFLKDYFSENIKSPIEDGIKNVPNKSGIIHLDLTAKELAEAIEKDKK
jgi:hypothetical protein